MPSWPRLAATLDDRRATRGHGARGRRRLAAATSSRTARCARSSAPRSDAIRPRSGSTGAAGIAVIPLHGKPAVDRRGRVLVQPVALRRSRSRRGRDRPGRGRGRRRDAARPPPSRPARGARAHARRAAEWRALAGPRPARLRSSGPGRSRRPSARRSGHGLVRPLRPCRCPPEGWTLTNPTPTPDAVRRPRGRRRAPTLDPVATWVPASGVTLGGAW